MELRVVDPAAAGDALVARDAAAHHETVADPGPDLLKDLGGDDETLLAKEYDRPIFVYNYPREVKAFYMKENPEDPRTVLNNDCLAPEGYGEIIGGSQREERLDVLERRMDELGLDKKGYDWYLDLRRYGTVPHAGFGGAELRHVRDDRRAGRRRPA